MSTEQKRPDEIVERAAQMRWDHYTAKGAKPLRWHQLTDAQKLLWLIAATPPRGGGGEHPMSTGQVIVYGIIAALTWGSIWIMRRSAA